MIKTLVLGGLLLGGASPVLADAPPTALLAGCAACHGAQGEGSARLEAPRLAGQDSDYLARQLRNFKSGRRAYHPQDLAGARMRAQVTALSDSTISQLASHYAALPLPPPAATPSTEAQAGQALYRQTCATCHGPNAQGYPQMKAPNLQLLDGAYLRQQLANYVRGWRGSEPHADIQGLWMRSIALQVGAPAAQQAVSAYIGSLGAAAE